MEGTILPQLPWNNALLFPIVSEPSLVSPFWLSNTMYGETVVFVQNVDRPAEAQLLFKPDRIVRVTDAAGTTDYVEGIDYAIVGAAGRMSLTEASRIGTLSEAELSAGDVDRVRERTICVTYDHTSDAGAWSPSVEGGPLPLVSDRLQRKQDLTICVLGDSISEGYDSSGFHGVMPHAPAYAQLVASTLEEQHGARVTLHNLAVAGSTAADGIWQAERVRDANPHLVIVAFGMNDACYAEAPEFLANIQELLRRVRIDAPQAEFVLVSPMLPTPACTWLDHRLFEGYRDALSTITGTGIAFADVTRLWTRLCSRKSPYDLSGNGLNHPNDFGHRLYAQTILESLRTARRRVSTSDRPRT
jgi:lysophospholipase L1-like esterase